MLKTDSSTVSRFDVRRRFGQQVFAEVIAVDEEVAGKYFLKIAR